MNTLVILETHAQVVSGRRPKVSVTKVPSHGPHRTHRFHSFTVVVCLFSNNSSIVADVFDIRCLVIARLFTMDNV
jgi:hypothetical protein